MSRMPGIPGAPAAVSHPGTYPPQQGYGAPRAGPAGFPAPGSFPAPTAGAPSSMGYPASGTMGTMGPPASAPAPVAHTMPAPTGTMASTPPAIPDVLNDPVARNVAEMGMRVGRDVIHSSVAAYLPGAVYMWSALRRYFAVDSVYVGHKLRALALPWRHAKWVREYEEHTEQRDGSQVRVQVPCEPSSDPNAPDLYIPSMALITYVLMVGLLKGTAMQFTPEILSDVSSSGIVALLLEVGIAFGVLRVFASTSSLPLLDLLSLAGYKYVGLCLVAVAYLLGDRYGYYPALLYAIAATTSFVAAFLKAALPPPEASAHKSQNVAVLTIAALQPLLMWWLGSFLQRE